MVLYTSSLFTCELIRISTRLVFVANGFSFSRSRSMADAFQLPAPVSINAPQEIQLIFTVRTGSIPLSFPLAFITVCLPLVFHNNILTCGDHYDNSDRLPP